MSDEPLSSVVVVDDERDEVRVRGARIAGYILRDGIHPSPDGRWFRIQSVTDVITVREKECRSDDDRLLLLRAMCAGLARWQPATFEVCCGGFCFATWLDAEGAPVVLDRMRAALVEALAPHPINPERDTP